MRNRSATRCRKLSTIGSNCLSYIIVIEFCWHISERKESHFHFMAWCCKAGDMLMLQTGDFCGTASSPVRPFISIKTWASWLPTTCHTCHWQIPGLPNNGVMISRSPDARDFAGVHQGLGPDKKTMPNLGFIWIFFNPIPWVKVEPVWPISLNFWPAFPQGGTWFRFETEACIGTVQPRHVL